MADMKTFFKSKTTGNEVALGKGVNSNHFLRCMRYFKFNITDWLGQGKKCTDKSIPAYEKRDSIDPPITFPIKLWVEGAIPETFYVGPQSAYTYFSMTWGWDPIVIREGFAISETARSFDQYARQRDTARRNLQELMRVLYTVRHSILNMMSDKERMSEQVQAFKKGSEEQIKGIFVDNYGGKGRTWTEVARNVPMVKSALSWFYKVNSIEEVDEAVENEQLNPVVANYLKRKMQEYETWKEEYKDWIFSSHDRLVDLIAEQQQNEKLYEKWAKKSIKQARRLEFDWDMVKGSISDIEFSRFAAKAGYRVEFMFYNEDKRVKQLMLPWHPCVVINLTMFYNPDLQGWKFTRTAHQHYYGAIHHEDLAILKKWVGLELGQSKLRQMMALQAGMTMEDLQKMEEEKQLAKAKEKVKEEEEEEEELAMEKPGGMWPKAPAVLTTAANKYWDLGEATRRFINKFGDTFLLPFGVGIYERANPKLMRAEAEAHHWFMNYYTAIKGDYGIPHYE